MNCPKVTPPFSDEDKKAILEYCHFVCGNNINNIMQDDKYTGFTHDEALAIILPTTNYDIGEAEFILAMARGELPTEIVDPDGTRYTIIY